MNYVFRLVKNSNYYDIWNSDKGERILNLIAPMGIFAKHTTIEPHRGMLCTSKGKIKKLDIPNQNIYNYHNGEIYLNYQKGLENLIGTPGLRYYWVKQSKNGTEINYYNNINQDYFSLL